MREIDQRLQRQYAFLTEIDKLKSIERQNRVTGSLKRENSAEHSWHVAVTAMILSEHAGVQLDLLRLVKMLLVHDLVEVYAGDSFVHTEDELKAQVESERSAALRLFGILPLDQGREVMELWEEFEARATPEAKFAKAIDRIQPALLHEATDAVVWQEHGTTRDQILAVMSGVREHTPDLWPKVLSVIESATVKGRLRK